MKRLLAVLALVVPFGATAQVPTEVAGAASQGLEQPAGSAAAEEGAGSLAVNPAGLLLGDALHLRYLHQEGSEAGWDGDGLYLAARPFGSLALGVAFEWLRPFEADARRRTTWGLALGGRSLSLGASAHVFTDGALDDSTTFDVGLIARPHRRLGVGLEVRDVDRTEIAGRKLPRRWVAALGLRPAGDWLTLTADAEIPEGGEIGDEGWDATALSYTARIRLVRGVGLFGAFAHGVEGDRPRVGQVGLSLDLSHLGVQAAPVLRSDDLKMGALVAVDLRSGPRESFALRPGRVALVDLDRALDGGNGLRLFPGARRDALVDLVEGLHRLERDPAVSAVVLRTRSLPDVGVGEAAELRQAILDFRRSGKPLYAHVLGADDTAYWAVSAAERIFASPETVLMVNGFATRVNFYADTLAMLGVRVQAVRVGAYKNAPETLTSDEIAPAHREVVESLLDDLDARYVAQVSESRRLSPEAFREAIAAGIQSASLARELGLVDEVLHPDELEGALRGRLGGAARLEEVKPRPAPYESWGAAPVIAVIPIDGVITEGRSSFGFSVTTGADTVAEALESAAADPRVKAIVLRIDSGGGDATGSQRIWRAAVKAGERKPLFAAMGDAAASGGYFAAVGARRIFATPNTLTGSIGIFYLKPNLRTLLEEYLEVGTYVSRRGDLAELHSVQTPWSEAELAALQRYVDDAYGDFVAAVAQGRGLAEAQVDEVARGRVWTGAQAAERGLVDDLGGLSAALRHARRSAGLAPDAAVEYRVYRPANALISFGAGASMELGKPELELPEPLAGAVRQLPTPLLSPGRTGLWALVPFEMEIR